MLKVAFIYDFDLTLCTKNMQEYSLLPMLNIEADSFWKEVGEIAKKDGMDAILAYMYMLVKKAKENNKPLTKDIITSLGKDIEYYPGVEEYFDRINEYALSKGIELQHYVISSGTEEIIEGSSIFNKFRKVYACKFHYDEQGNADWPAVAINYTGKTQFLFRINKNSLDISDNSKINAKMDIQDRDIAFNHMVYIADGMSDVPCMQLVKNSGGYSIAVHEDGSKTASQLVKDGRVNYAADANYCENSPLDKILHSILDKIAIDYTLEQYAK